MPKVTGKHHIVITAFIALMMVVGFKVYSLFEAVKPNPIMFWETHNASSDVEVNHDLWQQILNTYLSANHDDSYRGFDYAAVNHADKKKLSLYLASLKGIDPRTLNKTEQLAYWINLYNALTIHLVLEQYPINSIKDIGDGITGPWNMSLIKIAGQDISLNKIEHGILRALWQDNRIHYVINCASFSCPDLPTKALTFNNIDNALNNAAYRYVNQTKAVNFTSENTLVLSSIYTWFLVDFGDSHTALLQHLIKHSSPAQQQQLKQFKGEIDFTYDWKLNSPIHGQIK